MFLEIREPLTVTLTSSPLFQQPLQYHLMCVQNMTHHSALNNFCKVKAAFSYLPGYLFIPPAPNLVP